MRGRDMTVLQASLAEHQVIESKSDYPEEDLR